MRDAKAVNGTYVKKRCKVTSGTLVFAEAERLAAGAGVLLEAGEKTKFFVVNIEFFVHLKPC